MSSFSGSCGARFAPGTADSSSFADACATATVAVGLGSCGHHDGVQLTSDEPERTNNRKEELTTKCTLFFGDLAQTIACLLHPLFDLSNY